MSITLTTEQFQLLLASVANPNVSNNITMTKKIIVEQSKSDGLESFIENMEYLSVIKLMNMDIIEFIVNTIKNNIDHLEESEYPFVCANVSKRLFYYRVNGEWKKGTDFMKTLYCKIIKRAYRDINDRYTQKYNDDDLNDDDAIEQKYSNSKDAEKQQILLNLCHIDKYSYESVYEKVLSKIAKFIKTDFIPNK